jgi:hypothetical protein
MRRIAAVVAVLLVAGCPGGDPAESCPPPTKACGDGCIPASGVCCEVPGADSSSYCAGQGVSTCVTDRTCAAAFPAEQTARYCCSETGDFGSNDCPAGEHHCGLSCQAAPCVAAPAGTDATADPGPDAADGEAAGGTCVFAGSLCAEDAICCNGQATTRSWDGICSCRYVDGLPCWADDVGAELPDQECCNSPSGTGGMGVVRTPCPATKTGTCTTDADCQVQTKCIFFGDEYNCQGVCWGTGTAPTATEPCCEGYVVATRAKIQGQCALASGRMCDYGDECASGTCVPGATNATCL